MNRNIVITLAYNLPSEVEKATARLYQQNDRADFEHFIFDLGFPICRGDVIPESIKVAKYENAEALLRICTTYGSQYELMQNRGVSQNWTAALNMFQLHSTDVVIGLDADEITHDDRWVTAMADVLRSDHIGLCAPMMTDHKDIMGAFNHKEAVIAGHNVYIMRGILNYAIMGLSGRFVNSIGSVIPVPAKAEKYGYLESALHPLLKQNGYEWCILKDYRVTHTDTVQLYREWKDWIVLKNAGKPQIGFEEFLFKKRSEKIT